MHEGYEVDPVIASEAVDWLGTKGKALNEAGQSFFLAINLVNPHDIMEFNTSGYRSPFLGLGGAPDGEVYRKTYQDPASASWDFDLNDPAVPQAIRTFHQKWTMQSGPVQGEEAWKEYQDYYYNCIQDSDNNLMTILSAIRAQGLLDNSILVFTADHGEAHGAHGLKGKGGFLYDRNVHVPLIIVHPEHGGGASVSAITSHLDLAPTFLAMTNSPERERLTQDLPGHNLMDLMTGAKDSLREGALFCYEMISLASLDITPDGNGGMAFSFDREARGMVRGLITEKHKFVRYFSALNFNLPETIEELYANNDVQLFDCVNDPGELVNLAADPQANRDLILSLNAQLNRLIAREIGEDKGQEVKDCLGKLMAPMGKEA